VAQTLAFARRRLRLYRLGVLCDSAHIKGRGINVNRISRANYWTVLGCFVRTVRSSMYS
jgi:hypothetical protein